MTRCKGDVIVDEEGISWGEIVSVDEMACRETEVEPRVEVGEDCFGVGVTATVGREAKVDHSSLRSPR